MMDSRILHIINTVLVFYLTLPTLIRLPFGIFGPEPIKTDFTSVVVLLVGFLFIAIIPFYYYFIIRAFKHCNLDNKYFKTTLLINVTYVLFGIIFTVFIYLKKGELAFMPRDIPLVVVILPNLLFVAGFVVFTIGYFKNKLIS